MMQLDAPVRWRRVPEARGAVGRNRHHTVSVAVPHHVQDFCLMPQDGGCASDDTGPGSPESCRPVVGPRPDPRPVAAKNRSPDHALVSQLRMPGFLAPRIAPELCRTVVGPRKDLALIR